MTFSLTEALNKQGIQLTDQAIQQFETYYSMLIEWNEKINLTAITDYDGVMEKHFYDSVTPAFFHDFREVHRLADIGAGAGFPSIPLKILHPHIEVTIIDSLNKRIRFLEELTTALGLTGVQCIHGRAEEVARKAEHRDQYPLVLARAVARLPVLLELCLPFVSVRGTFLALKGSGGEEEAEESRKALNTLGGDIKRREVLHLPQEGSQRVLIWVHKEKPTPKAYPRKPGTPNKNPIL